MLKWAYRLARWRRHACACTNYSNERRISNGKPPDENADDLHNNWQANGIAKAFVQEAHFECNANRNTDD